MTNRDRPKVVVLVESLYIPSELRDYLSVFSSHGIEVEFYSRLWGNESLRFFSLVENAQETMESITVENAVEWFSNDVSDPKHRRLEDYDAVIATAAFTSVRLRYYDVNRGESIRTTPVVEFFAQAMADRRLIKGALCHGLWLATPRPENLAGRKVTCHEVVEADVMNAGAEIVRKPAMRDGKPLKHANGEPLLTNEELVDDGDLLTGKSKNEAGIMAEAIARKISLVRSGGKLPWI
jgi:protease I